MANSIIQSEADWLARIESACLALPNPESYEGPGPTPAPVLPRNLLLFSRARARQLSGKGHATAPPHQHHRHVLICALQGSGRVWVDSESFLLKPGHALLIFPHQKHSYADVAPARICWLYVTFDHGKDDRLERLRSRDPVALKDPYRATLAALLNAWRDDKEAALLHAAALLRSLSSTPTPRRKREAARPTDALLGKINRYAFRRRTGAASTEELAGEVGMSASYLRARFRQMTGQSLGSHLRDFRLKYACSLLSETEQRVGEVALECGYDSPFTFSRAFSHAMGCSPRDYRARFHGG